MLQADDVCGLRKRSFQIPVDVLAYLPIVELSASGIHSWRDASIGSKVFGAGKPLDPPDF
jgi:hypothetical protein